MFGLLQLSTMTDKTNKFRKNKINSPNLDHREFDSKHAATSSSYTDSHTALDDTLALGVQAWKGSYQ